MTPRTNKAKAAGIGTSSFLDLKAELAAKEKEIAENRAVGKKTASSGQKPGKVSDFPPLTAHPLENAMLMRFFFGRSGQKPTVWSRPNKGVKARAAKDIELEAIARPTIETSYAILERKSRIYEKLDKGKDAGLSEKQYGSLLVDVSWWPDHLWTTAHQLLAVRPKIGGRPIF